MSNPTCVYLTIPQSLFWLQALGKQSPQLERERQTNVHGNNISLYLAVSPSLPLFVMGNQGSQGSGEEF